MMHMLCQHPTCSRYADREVKVEGTAFSYLVCMTDVSWAKREILKDFPGRRVVAQFLRG
ncbi:hypothetical protein GA0074692_4456 [Micromonospora pallida]|uniref:Uncharacterized protein n=1 Tax=Micromonospora pallida TaxID=145854 RepID=A0A1C6T549_9ACTN|nr:hypothetical protein [Micromonospora pallida]SCL36817.1 hypothetical protein GA0074692_4456 [Micromonospora pallida]